MATAQRETTATRKRRLAAARRRATALLAAVTALFIAVTAYGVHNNTLLGYIQAGAEAAMVGGVADWFAVTALFRRPLGLPIPHTALIVERKDQFAATLGQFVQENFLNADVLTERIKSVALVPRLTTALADKQNATRLAGYAANAAVTLADALRDEDVQRVITEEITKALDTVEVAPLAGRVLRVVIAGGPPTSISPIMTPSCVTCSRAKLPAGCPTRYTGGSLTGCSPAYASAWQRWLPTPAIPPAASSTDGWQPCPTASKLTPSSAAAVRSSSTMS
jgi:hypothetical protein